MEYRITTKDDIEILMAVRLETIRRVNGLSDDHRFSDELIERSKRYFLEGDQTTVVAEQDGMAVGCASISYIEVMPTLSHPTGKRAHLMNVYTRADYRRKGIARKLVGMLIDEAKEKGITEISLDATDLGRALYESLGFCKSDECMVMNLPK
ncbi:MAG: GNAT family N-acetyltransferase [Oscillospiraceae bacterium]|nr:GNAT family N-acetyltransferase [Oscillospiraceae bacterium]MDE7172233.1 GNAT family N-acetyltransferase [Oscillospiraceae bacterium]